jgi:ATP-dependent Lon protease
MQLRKRQISEVTDETDPGKRPCINPSIFPPEDTSGGETITEEEYMSEDNDTSESSSVFNLEKELENLQDLDPGLYDTFQQVQSEIERTEPNARDLLTIPMRLEDRAKLCQHYEIYKTCAPNTDEWLAARNRYNKLLIDYRTGYKLHSQYSATDIADMADKVTKLSSFNPQLTLKYRILNLPCTDQIKGVIYRKYEEMLDLSPSDEEYGKIKTWLTWAISIPYNFVKQVTVSNMTEFITNARKRLDQELFGMDKVKEQILLVLTARIRNPDQVHANLGLVGPPGTGKTAIARLIAEIMGCGFSQISLGGVDKSEVLKGHDYTYIGSQPGEIVRCLRNMGHKNGIIFLDELEKVSDKPEIRAALLHVLDPSQNRDFHDLYLADIGMDLSRIWWVGSMNSLPHDNALADRWWIINVEGYTFKEKIRIVQDYIIPKELRNTGLSSSFITMNAATTGILIERVCSSMDKGVRALEKSIKDIVAKIIFLVTHQDDNGGLPFKVSFNPGYKLTYPVTVDNVLLEKLLERRELDTMMMSMYI